MTVSFNKGAYIGGSTSPCASNITLQPGVKQTVCTSTMDSGRYVLITRGKAGLPICRVDVTAPYINATAPLTYCPYDSSADPPVLPPGSWVQTCSNAYISPSNCSLSAQCGMQRHAPLDVRQCQGGLVANSFGTLVCDNPGGE